ncbi:MAG: DUF6702 family protein [Flavobacteriales bacterium AspAUS03]
MFRLYVFLMLFLSGYLDVFGQVLNISTVDIELPSGSTLISTSIKLPTEKLIQVLQTGSSSPQFERILKAYVEKKFNLRINGKPNTLRFVGKRVDEKFTWLEYESSVESTVSEVKVSNSLLIEQHSNQRNIINFSIRGTRKTVICQKGCEEQQLSF